MIEIKTRLEMYGRLPTQELVEELNRRQDHRDLDRKYGYAANPVNEQIIKQIKGILDSRGIFF